MLYISTRGGGDAVAFSQALTQGLAPDGGLFVPTAWPELDAGAIAGAAFADAAAAVAAPFLAGDKLAAQAGDIARDAFNFPAPLVKLSGEAPLYVLELFHGPTAAFKDFGARFLAACFARLRTDAERPLQILVATSGDTGGAVAAAFHKRPGIEVAVLFPKGLVSPVQERQLTCWGDNVKSFAVRGTFDDCQRLVKAAFADQRLQKSRDLSSANSINIGRLVPQMTYFAASSVAAAQAHGAPANFVIPSGNLGHATACVWARQVGFPIGEIVLAHNANATMPDYLESGAWAPRDSVATLASAMDVGNPSNAERLRHMFPGVDDLRGAVSAYVVDDEAIRDGIRLGLDAYGQIWCPHTAVALQAWRRHAPKSAAQGAWVLAATAHAAKFPEIVTPIVGRAPEAPKALQDLLSRPTAVTEIGADLDALIGALG